VLLGKDHDPIGVALLNYYQTADGVLHETCL